METLPFGQDEDSGMAAAQKCGRDNVGAREEQAGEMIASFKLDSPAPSSGKLGAAGQKVPARPTPWRSSAVEAPEPSVALQGQSVVGATRRRAAPRSQKVEPRWRAECSAEMLWQQQSVRHGHRRGAFKEVLLCARPS